MENICQSCLSLGRNLAYLPTDELCSIYKQLLKEIKVYDPLLIPQLCWECLALLRSYQRLKHRVQRAQLLLQQDAKTITTLSSLQTKSLDIFIYPDLEITDECEISHTEIDEQPIKEEIPILDNIEVINNEVPKKKKSKIKSRKIKKKTLKRKKKSESDNQSVHSDFNCSDQDVPLNEINIERNENKEKVADDSEKSQVKYKTIVLEENEIYDMMNEMRTAAEFTKCNHKCMSCVVSFKNRDLLDIHNKSLHHKSSGPDLCPYCKSYFPSTTELNQHITSHSTRHECLVCGHRLTTVTAMEAHLLLHIGYECEMCSHYSSSSLLHETHMNRSHGVRPRCAECGRVFSSLKTYRYHLDVLHKGQNRFPCPHCNRVYQWKSNLWRHIKNHKAQDTGELYCSECDKKFSSIATYRQHLKISRRHVAESQFDFTCQQCGKKFVNKTKLKDHIDWEHLNKTNYKCRLCAKAFKSHTSLYVHLQNVHRNKEEKDNLCHVCGKSYQSNAKLKYHISAMHSSVTPFSCDSCGAAFSWYSSLYRHVRQAHSQVKPMKKVKKTKQRDEEILPSIPLQIVLPMIDNSAPV